MGKRHFFQQVLLGNLDSYMQINETRTHLHSMHENKLKMVERLKYTTGHHQTPRRGTNEPFHRKETHGLGEQTCGCQGGGGASGMDWEFGFNRCKALPL